MVFVFQFVGVKGVIAQQNSEYEWTLRPSFWYNSTDGVQAGVRFFGFRDTPELGDYRIKGGVWLNTFFPEIPVNYELSLDHPVHRLSGIQEEFTLGAGSKLREGRHQHTVYFSNRWQRANSDDNFMNFRVSAQIYELFDEGYLFYPGSWTEGLKHSLNVSLYNRQVTNRGSYFTFSTDFALLDEFSDYTYGLSGSLHLPISDFFQLGLAFISRHQSDQFGQPEHASNLTFPTAFESYQNPWARSKGIISPKMMDNGYFNVNTLANMRGYARHDATRFQNGSFSNITHLNVASVQLEIENPINRKLNENNYSGTFSAFKTYLFTDAAVVSYNDNATTSSFIQSGGVGILLHLNIPDYYANARGFSIRWDVPFWVSEPLPDEKAVKFRNQLSFDIIIPF